MNALILIAEDEPEIAEILDAYLTREGYRTYQVANGQSALDVQPVLKPDLVLLDIKMPGKDGWEVLSELRRRGDTPVVIVTALDQDIDRLQGLRIGADDYVAKPFNPVEVVARVGAVLRRTGGHARSRCCAWDASKSTRKAIWRACVRLPASAARKRAACSLR